MGKITVKHFLNTNAKPVTINKDKYYYVKMLITVNRFTFRISSKEFNEVYTETMFNEFVNPENENYKYIQKEESTIQNIIAAQLGINNEFSQMLFNVLTQTLPKNSVTENTAFMEIMRYRYKLFRIVNQNEKDFKNRPINKFLGMIFFSFWELFTPEIQKKIILALLENGFPEKEILNINKAALCCYFDDTLKVLANTIDKYKPLLQFDYGKETAFNIVKYRDSFFEDEKEAIKMWQNSGKENDKFEDYYTE